MEQDYPLMDCFVQISAPVQKDIMEEIARYNEEKGDPDYYYLPEQWNGKKLQWISPADTSGKMLTGIFLIAAMIVLVMKGREE